MYIYPCSPLLFNLCFNTLMTAVADKAYSQLEYMCGPNSALNSPSWMQFADDAALVAHDVKSAQTLIDVCVAWCTWADMKLRIDKCSTFGVAKHSGKFAQFLPSLFVLDTALPVIQLGCEFKYLGRIYSCKLLHG